VREIKMRAEDPDLSLFTAWRADIFGVAGLLPYSLELIGFRRKKAPVLVEAFRSLFTINAMPLPLRGLVASSEVETDRSLNLRISSHSECVDRLLL
jgi:hypothetical protein